MNEREFNRDPRAYALNMVENGLVSADDMLLNAVVYMSHDDVKGMLDANELSPRFFEEAEGVSEEEDEA